MKMVSSSFIRIMYPDKVLSSNKKVPVSSSEWWLFNLSIVESKRASKSIGLCSALVIVPSLGTNSSLYWRSKFVVRAKNSWLSLYYDLVSLLPSHTGLWSIKMLSSQNSGRSPSPSLTRSHTISRLSWNLFLIVWPLPLNKPFMTSSAVLVITIGIGGFFINLLFLGYSGTIKTASSLYLVHA